MSDVTGEDLIAYLNYGLQQLKLTLADLCSIGTLQIIHSDQIVDAVIADRIVGIARTIDEIYRTKGDDAGLYAERNLQLLSYDQYLSTVNSIDRIRLKLSEAEGQLVRMVPGRTGNDVEDKYYAKAMEKKFGYNPTADWKKADKIIEAQRKLYMQYDATSLELARTFNAQVHTADREGYLNWVYNREEELIESLLKSVPITPERDELRAHAYITGGSGSGKTELLKQFIHAAFHRTDEAVVVIDPHGDMVEQIAKWAYFVGSDDIVYIDPFLDENLIPPFNPLIVPDGTSMREKEVIAQQLVGAFEQLLKGSAGDSLTVNMRAVLSPCILTLLDRPGSTLADLQRFMNDRINDDLVELGLRSRRRANRDFFAYEFRDDPSLRPSKTAISRKLQSLFNTYVFDSMTNNPNTINLGELIDEGKIILFNLSKGRLGDDASEAFGRLVVATVQGFALRRADIPEDQRVPINLFIDEAHNYLSRSIETLSAETRKYGVSMTLAQQIVGQGMSQEMQSLVLNNTNIKAAGRTPEDDKMAKTLAKKQTDVQRLNTGEFWMKVGNGETFKLKVGGDLIGDNIAMSDDNWAIMCTEQLKRYRPIDDDLPALEIEPDDDGEPMPWPETD